MQELDIAQVYDRPYRLNYSIIKKFIKDRKLPLQAYDLKNLQKLFQRVIIYNTHYLQSLNMAEKLQGFCNMGNCCNMSKKKNVNRLEQV